MSAILSVLCASTVGYDAGRGGEAELTRTEFASLLCGLSDEAVNFALAKYCDDMEAFRLSQFHCMMRAAEFANVYGWKAKRGKPVIMSLGGLAVIESINERLCFACNSPLLIGKKRCSCDNVRSRLLHVDRCDYVGVSESKWRLTWRNRYEYLFSYCQGLDVEVGYAVSRNNK